jgi:GrpB-like predicted nucleotidyltransferase (UPF0157 family)
VKIVSYDPQTERLFGIIKKKIQDVLGEDVEVEHCGASSFGISGQDEIDVSIVTSHDNFGEYVTKLDAAAVGEVAAWYEERVRFKVNEEGKKIDLKIIDKDHLGYLRGKAFEDYLRSHPEDLERYRVLKEASDGLTTKEYYRRKIEFINEIVDNI